MRGNSQRNNVRRAVFLDLNGKAVKRFGGCGCLVGTGYAAQDAEVYRARRVSAYTGRTFGEVVE